ncbi:Diphthamide biosynthesis protein 3 [Stygiomarasmius scandens]|uniref:Diphthamide biosynthesis protein 3 n=1 Tax=Marasmiellus scandens TaxID=2682957 RepID=A0ABR1JVZ2_9AGAR
MYPSCSLIIRVIYGPLSFEDDDEEDQGDEEEEEETESEGGDEYFEDAMERLTIVEIAAWRLKDFVCQS